MQIHDLEAERKWRRIPKDLQQEIIRNVFCSNCFTTTIIDFTLHNEDHGVLLKGNCEQCGKKVARLVEDA